MPATAVTRRRKRHGSYPYFSVMFSITMALFVIGLFGEVLLHANRLSEVVRGGIRMQIYLKREVTENERISFYKTLAERPYVAREGQEPQLEFISKEQAAEELSREIQGADSNFTQLLGSNPLRDAFIMRVQRDYATSEAMQQIKEELEAMPSVFEVFYIESVVSAINRNITQISLVLLTLALVLVLTVVVLINNTIKLALFSQRFLIRSMQLVGATSWFIQRPFLWRAIWQGLLSGTIASGLLYLLLEWAYRQIPELENLRQDELFWGLCLSLLLTGGLIGFFSAYASVRRYLRMSLDELY